MLGKYQKKKVAILILAFIFHSKPHAEMLMIGYGATSCEGYTQTTQNNGFMKHVFVSWAHGYMSAINARNTTTNNDVNLSSALPLSGQINFLTEYCEKNPDKWFLEGVMELMSILAKT